MPTGPGLCGLHSAVYDINPLLLVFHSSVDLVIAASAQINHEIFVPEEKHDRTQIVQVTCSVKVRNSCNICEVTAKCLTFSVMLYRASSIFAHVGFPIVFKRMVSHCADEGACIATC